MEKRKIRGWIDFGIPIFLLTVCTILFRQTNWDIAFQSHFYSEASGWFLKDTPFWEFLYDFGNIPALLIAVGSLVFLGVSFFRISYVKFRKIFLFFILVMIVGPGLLINTILKDNWGRPRPRNIEEFGGNYPYEKVLDIDPDSSGKSFPCGHASMGFYLFTLFLVCRRTLIKSALFFLIFAIILGGLIGFARIVQGGHFFSDVIWAGGLTYLVSAGFFYLLRLDKNLYFTAKTQSTPLKKKLIVIGIGTAVIILILLILLASPYSYQKKYDLPDDAGNLSIEIDFPRADVEFSKADKSEIGIEASGHGFPWSKLKTKLKQDEDKITLSQRESGFFTEVVQLVKISIDDSNYQDFLIKLDEGNVILADSLNAVKIRTALPKGRVIRRF
ncbi:MAG TPA: phosphatase PAP2 family protein [Candidatus Cloacimonadota bacterium]|nr:phosphatase PAP2 family protein [Candidatus Cloacimonadota bacterium]